MPFQRSSSSANPFDAAHYEDWYLGPGGSADRLEKELLFKALETFPEWETLLEVGCGTGHFTRWFREQGLATMGVDVSRTMLAEARRRGTSACVVADASALPFADRSFDLVALVAALEFLAEPARALQKAVRSIPCVRRLLSETIEHFLRDLDSRGLEVRPGPMSTLVLGSTDALFDGLKRAFQEAAEAGQVVMVATFSNACAIEKTEP